MGQHVSSINSQIINLLESNILIRSPASVVATVGPEDVRLFLSSDIPTDTTSGKYPISKQGANQIQNYLNLLTNIPEFEAVNNQVDTIFLSMSNDYQQIIQEINNNFEIREKIIASLFNTLKIDRTESSFASRISTLFKSIKEHASNNHSTDKQLEKILHNLLFSKTSFKHILSILSELLFDTHKTYDLHKILPQFNDHFIIIRDEWEKQQIKINNKPTIDAKLLEQLHSIGGFPNTRLKNMPAKQFTGQFVSLFIFTHIDFHNRVNTNKQFNSGSTSSSMSFEFHPDTYKQLFDIIKKLTAVPTKDFNINLNYILIICLRLFAVHLKFLFAITTNPSYRFLLTNNNRIRNDDVNQEINVSDFNISNDDLQLWSDTLLMLACREYEKSEQMITCSLASKCFIQILNGKVSSFTEKLSFIHQYIIENKHYILIRDFLTEFNTNTVLLTWIEVLCDNRLDNRIAFNILYLFLDIYFNPSNEMKPKILNLIQQIIQRFQRIVFMQLSSTYSLANKYISYILKNFNRKLETTNDLLNPILISLALMKEPHFNFTTIQIVVSNVLPLLVEFTLKNSTNEAPVAQNLHYIYWLLGKITSTMIIGSQTDALEIKYAEKLQSPLFTGGCEQLTNESNQYLSSLFESNIASYIQLKTSDFNFEQSSSDQEFLMSVYNNIDQGAQLISKIKTSIKDKQYLLQKSTEQQANHSCAAVFAVYLKFYRRINLAKYELNRTDDKKANKKLLSIFEYATHVYSLFARTKGQGGNCDELYQQIKANTLFLLTSVKENNLIPIIECVSDEHISKPIFRRQNTRRPITKHDFRLIRNVFQACTRFKKLMIVKKEIAEEKQKSESVLRRTIDNFIFNEKKFEPYELIQCMSRQYERAMMRLIMYQFSHKFIQNVLDFNDKTQILTYLRIYLPHLRQTTIEWSYLENISAINMQLKEGLSRNYHLIIKQIFSYLSQLQDKNQMVLIQNMFYLLNLSYELIDIYYLYKDDFLTILYNTYMHLNLDIKFICYTWFRLYVFKFCENFPIEPNSTLKQIQELIFDKIILNELSVLRQSSPIKTENKSLDEKYSFNNVTIEWFTKANDTNNLSSEFEINLYISQYLMILLRHIQSYEHVQSYCATGKFIEELIYIYEHSDSQITCLLCLKILRRIIIFLSEDANEQIKSMVNNFLSNILFSIGKTTPDITSELIYVYRTMMSFESPWQMTSIEFVFNKITTNFKSFESIDNILASLCILGGYIHPFCLGSIVEIHDTDETQLGVIIDINRDARALNTADVQPYLVQYIDTNKTQWMHADKLKVELTVLPPNLLELPNVNEFIDLLFDALGYFIQYDQSTMDSILLLQLKRRSIAVLYRILNHKDLVDIFIQKPYLSIIAELLKTKQQTIDFHLLNKHQREQYCLSLDRCQPLRKIIPDKNKIVNDEFIIWTKMPFKINSLNNDFTATNEWKSFMSKRDLQSFKQGRSGNDEIKIVELSSQLAGKWFVEECGIEHRLPGKIYLVSESSNISFGTFIVENLQLTQGNWYFCVRLLESTFARIGWITNGFQPSESIGIGHDQYSWSYDGSQGMIYNNEQYPFHLGNIRWSTNDVCGCGIEINGGRIRINYWLNGLFLGTAFEHNRPIYSTTSTLCNMLPNGNQTSYFPGVTLKVDDAAILSGCEFIFHPMDMFECPLPEGYKPLLVPTLVDIDDSFVPYPCNAYLIGNNIEDYFIHKRNNKSTRFLCDFINGDHLESKFLVDKHQLILSEQDQGFPLTIDDHHSWSISFDFSVLKTTNDYLDIPLLTFDTYSIRIPVNKVTTNTQIAIVRQTNERKIKVYVNNECRISECPIMTQFYLHVLPSVAVGMRNLAIWKYELSEEHIQRLFTSGLSYIAADYHKLNEYKKQVNLLTFTKNQQYFENDLLVPLNESFDEMKWEKKKIESDEDESKYFNPNHGNMQLFGNKSYLVLNKSINSWSEYTLIFDLSIDSFPVAIVKLNTRTEICITPDGQICLSIANERAIQNGIKIKLNEYIRLVISVQNQSIKIYVNGSMEFNTNLDKNLLTITNKHIDLFHQSDLTKNSMNEDQLRIECKSIAYLNKALNDIDEKLASPNYSLEHVVAYPYSIISPSLIHIGYDESLIKLAMKLTTTRNIQLIATILRENKFNQYNENLLSKIGFSISREKLKDLIDFSNYDTEEKLPNLAEILLNHWHDIHIVSSLTTDKSWFQQTVNYLNIDDNLTEWIRDRSKTVEQFDLTYHLFDLDQSNTQEQTNIPTDQLKKTEYNHRDLTEENYHECRLACEYGLISIYAHYTILNILRVWSYDGSSLFPLEKFGDCTFIVKLLRLLDYHYRYTRLHTDEAIDRMSLLINSILKIELNELIKYCRIKKNRISYDILQSKAQLLYHLQKDIMIQSMRFFINPSLLNSKYNNEYEVEKPNFNFILKLVHLFVKLISEKSTIKQVDIDLLIPLVFPESLINVLFNLFLINPKHENKIIILRLFSTLIQASDHFNLSTTIQQFFFRLFTELQPNSTSITTQIMRTFQIAIMDFVFLLTEKQKSQSVSTELTNQISALPQSFHDLLIIVDVINALTDKNKQTLFPELFIIQSIILLGENHQFTSVDIEQSNKHFDTKSDLQLIHFMNNNQLLKISFIEFISSLPTEPTPNTLYYKNYPSLWHIPAICIQIRAKLIYQFNLLVEQLVSFIDFSLFPGQSIFTDKIQKVKSYILYETKSKLFNTAVTLSVEEANTGIHTVNFDTVQANTNKRTMFQQAYEQLHTIAHTMFRKENDQVWRAQYLAMHSTDQGGPFRDSVTCICADICSTQLSLFILCPNGRTNSGCNDDRWIPKATPPNEPLPNRIRKQYRFIGQLMGMAIRRKHYLNLKFPNLLWKQLVREQITAEDIENIDIQSFTMINEMERSIKENDSSSETNELLSSILDELRYEVVSSNGQTYELVPNGKNIPITVSNLNDYCTSYREYRLNEFNRQIECIRQGLYSIVPGYFLGLFTASELEEIVCGKGEMDVELLKRNTGYGGHYNQETPCIQRLWKILREIFNEEQKKLFLKFVWGRCTLPSCDDDFGSKFQIVPYTLSAELVDGALPRAHTCTFVLDLPEYSTIDIMYDRLNYAITYCTSIDGDGNMNDDPMPTNLDSDSATEE
ncbi:unnamed protein product [Rotaria socialis]